MGSLCGKGSEKNDPDTEEYQRPYIPDSDDSSLDDEPVPDQSDDEGGDKGKKKEGGGKGTGDNSDDDDHKKKGSGSEGDDNETENDEKDKEKPPLERVMTPVAQQKHVLAGWRDAVTTGNDSLAYTLWKDYRDVDVINHVYDDGFNSLHIASKNSHYKIAWFVLKQGIDVNAVTSKTGNTALHFACENRNETMVRLVLKNNIDPDIKNKIGKTGSMIAKRYRAHHLEREIQRARDAREIGKIYGWDDPEPVILDENDKHSGSEDDNLFDKDEDGKELNEDGTEIYEDIFDNSHQTEEEKLQEQRDMELFKLTQSNPFVGRKLASKQRKKLVDTSGKATKGYATDGEYNDDDDDHEPSVSHSTSTRGRSNTTGMVDKLEQQRARLPELEGWLEKKKPKPQFGFERRWFVVQDGWILWSSTKKTIDDPTIQEQRRLWNNCVALENILDIERISSKDNTKFNVKTKKKGYVFRTPTKQDRNYWIHGIKQHMRFQQELRKYGL